MLAWLVLAHALTTACCLAAEAPAALPRDYNVKPVPFSRVHVDDAFWEPRLETSRKVTIPYAFEQCEATDRISNFEKAAGLLEGDHKGAHFNDSDVYKVMEGAAYALQVHPDRLMRLYLDQLIRVMAAAQWDDGYLFTFYSVPKPQPEKLWTNIPWIHEQYCVGHMYEAAVAHHEVTGERTFLDVATKNADLICRVFNADNRTDPPGHQEIEIGLCKLYRVTGDEKYLAQAKFFLDQRGHKGRRGPDGKGGLYGTYGQDHIPVVEQTKAVGHSVRAAYLYTGMADVAALTGDMAYVKAINTIWDDVVTAKLYVTGGIGAAGGHEGFGGRYELPNMSAYCETCASVANILWNHRMFLMHGDAKYIDVLERTLYNAALSGIALGGDRFFYPNVLESIGQHARSPWFGCACCPSNIARFIPSVPGFAYARKDKDLYVNLFIGGDVTVEPPGNKVTLRQTTRYPWEGHVRITVEPERKDAFAVCIRIPGWARNQPVPSDLYAFAKAAPDKVALEVNGNPVPVKLKQGYARIERTWTKGDVIELTLPMPVRRVTSHPEVVTNKGKVALQRGPVVYCLEGPDNDGQVLDLVIPDEAELTTAFKPDLLGGVVTISGQARTAKRTLDARIVPDAKRPFTAIPYYAWAHRGRGQMTVWPARVPEAASPQPADTLTYTSKTTASFVHVSLDAIKDQNVPANSADSSGLQLDFWPHKGTTEWVQFAWDKAHELTSVKVYWFDDTGRGECHLPESWRVLTRDADGRFKPVKNRGPYGTRKDTFNTVEFEPVKTSALKLEIKLQEKWSAGIQEVVIEPTGEPPAAPSAAVAGTRNVTLISTSDSHYKAFESRQWNELNRETINEINRIAGRPWPDKLGSDGIDTPRGVVLLGDCIDDGDRVVEGRDYTAEQFRTFIAHFGLDGTDGLLTFRVFETWGNHDGPPIGKSTKSPLNFQAELKKRNAIRRQKGWLTNLSANGLHYAWDWDDVHLVSLGIYPADRQNAKVRYNPVWHDPQGALTFLEQDLAKHVSDSGRPVVLMSHAGFDSDWWHPDDWKAVYNVAKRYNVVLYLYGHTGTGLRDWAPEGEPKKWTCINDGHTTSGFFVIQLKGDRLRAAYRCKEKLKVTRNPDRTHTIEWDGQWGWRFPLDRKIPAPARR